MGYMEHVMPINQSLALLISFDSGYEGEGKGHQCSYAKSSYLI